MYSKASDSHTAKNSNWYANLNVFVCLFYLNVCAVLAQYVASETDVSQIKSVPCLNVRVRFSSAWVTKINLFKKASYRAVEKQMNTRVAQDTGISGPTQK